MKDQIGTMYGDQAPLTDIISGAAAQFRDYERQHNEKRTTEGRKKALVNAGCASILEAALPRFKDMQEELDYWRKEAIARAWSASVSIGVDLDQGDTADALKTFIMVLQPATKAMDGARDKDFHAACVGCGGDLLNGHKVINYDDGECCHADCKNPMSDDRLDDEEKASVSIYDDAFGPADVEKMMTLIRDTVQRMEAANG